MLLLNARLDGVGEPGSTARCGLGDNVNIHTFSMLSTAGRIRITEDFRPESAVHLGLVTTIRETVLSAVSRSSHQAYGQWLLRVAERWTQLSGTSRLSFSVTARIRTVSSNIETWNSGDEP